ncbi:MAG: PilZ domain-containing protein [Byssovorax sp.]
MNLRKLTPPTGIPIPAPTAGLKPTRRVGGARHTISVRVAFFREEREIPGWALNMSRTGLRAIVEDEHIDVGAPLVVRVGDDPVHRAVRVVWTSPEPDGTIVGLEFFEPLPEWLVIEREARPSDMAPPALAAEAAERLSDDGLSLSAEAPDLR